MIKKRPMSADGKNVERRKTHRFPVSVPIEVSWHGPDGSIFKEHAVAGQVNANGGFLNMSVYPPVGSRVTLANFLSAQTADARVLAAPNAREGVANGIIVELITPSESLIGLRGFFRRYFEEMPFPTAVSSAPASSSIRCS